jgi:hypothetical protein
MFKKLIIFLFLFNYKYYIYINYIKKGANEVTFNMTLRIPTPYCVPDYKNSLECHNVTAVI